MVLQREVMNLKLLQNTLSMHILISHLLEFKFHEEISTPKIKSKAIILIKHKVMGLIQPP